MSISIHSPWHLQKLNNQLPLYASIDLQLSVVTHLKKKNWNTETKYNDIVITLLIKLVDKRVNSMMLLCIKNTWWSKSYQQAAVILTMWSVIHKILSVKAVGMTKIMTNNARPYNLFISICTHRSLFVGVPAHLLVYRNS